MSFVIPESFVDRTNLIDAFISVEWVSGESSCMAQNFIYDTNSTGTRIVGDKTYTYADYTEGAAGSIYEENVYAYSSGNYCYLIRLHIQSSHADSDPDNLLKEYNRRAILNIFDKMLYSFNLAE